jgi:hypothetical protein
VAATVIGLGDADDAPAEQAASNRAKAARKVKTARDRTGRRADLGDGDTSRTSERIGRSEGSRESRTPRFERIERGV